MAEQTDKLIVNALDRALDIMIYMYEQGHPVRISDIARDLEQYKSTIYRALYTMEQRGFVEKDPMNDTYWLGMKLFAIGSRVQEKMSITNLVQPYAKALYDELHEVVNLSVLELHGVDRPKIIVVHKEESDSQLLKANPAIGKFSDCHSSAAGKCLLAYSDEFDIDIVEPFPLCQYTEHTVTQWDAFVQMIHQVREDGYAVDLEEREHGLTCIGAPILDRRGHAVAALSIAGPSNRMDQDLEGKIQRVKYMADLVSQKYI